jgi:ferrochelatase
VTKKAVLLLNLGSPDSTRVPDVRRYLREFLSDPRVLDVNPVLRAIVLNLFILPFRPRKSAAAYSTVWTKEGSPLIVTSKKQRDLLAAKVDVPVHLAMRYGRPAVPDVMSQIVADGTEELFLVPLYPHYAMSSYETAVVQAMEEVARQKPGMKVTLLQPYYNDPEYIDALADAAAPHLQDGYDTLVFSYHGVPERHLRKSDPSHAHCLAVPDCCHCAHPAHATCYRHQCVRTMELLIERLGIPREKTVLAFQSLPIVRHRLPRDARGGRRGLQGDLRGGGRGASQARAVPERKHQVDRFPRRTLPALDQRGELTRAGGNTMARTVAGRSAGTVTVSSLPIHRA